MIKIKYKSISESSLNYFSKMIYPEIQKFYDKKAVNEIPAINNNKIKKESKEKK